MAAAVDNSDPPVCIPECQPHHMLCCLCHSPQAAPSELQTAGELHFRPTVGLVLQHWVLGSMHLVPHLALPAMGQPAFEETSWHQTLHSFAPAAVEPAGQLRRQSWTDMQQQPTMHAE